MIIKRILRWLRKEIFPTEQDRIIRKWFAICGDKTLRLNYSLNEDSLVMDLGGYKGQWANDLYSKYKCRIFVFEPVRAFARNIEERFKDNSCISVSQNGLGATSRKETIYISADGSSIHGNSSDTEIIQIIDVKEWFDQFSDVQIQLMKVNIEGGEYELLERLLDTGLIKKIENIQVQFHNLSKKSEAQMRRIQKKMKDTHDLTYQYKFVWENWKKRNM